MKKIILAALLLTLIHLLPALATEGEKDLGFALKQTGTLNISRDGNTITVNGYDSRMETLWYKSEIPVEELTYTLTM